MLKFPFSPPVPFPKHIFFQSPSSLIYLLFPTTAPCETAVAALNGQIYSYASKEMVKLFMC